MTARSRTIQSLVGIAVSAGLIAWLCIALDWGEVWLALRDVHYLVLAPLAALTVVHYVIRAWRWRYLLPPPPNGLEPPVRHLFDAIMIGGFATFVLPLRAGEFIRPALLSRTSSYGFSSSFVSVVIERFFDLAVVLLSFALLALYIPGIPDWVNSGAYALTLLAVAIFAFMVVGSVAPNLVAAPVAFFCRFLPRKLAALIGRLVNELISGAAVLKDPKRLFAISFLSVLVWLSCYLNFYVTLFLFDVPASLGLGIAIAVIVALAVAAPSAPGFIGVYQTACVAGFMLYGLSKEIGVAYSIISHVLQYVLMVGYGVYYLLKNNVRLGELRAAS